MTVLPMFYGLMAQGEGSITVDTRGGGGERLEGSRIPPYKQPLYHQFASRRPQVLAPNFHQLPRGLGCKERIGQQTQSPRQVGVGTGRNVPSQLPATDPVTPRPKYFHHLQVRVLMMQGRQPSEPAWPEALKSTGQLTTLPLALRPCIAGVRKQAGEDPAGNKG